jgi:hypothetical protein
MSNSVVQGESSGSQARAAYRIVQAAINNIDIGDTGVAGEANTIRIGGTAQTVTYIAGIIGAKITGSEVLITPSGQLGTKASAERYKTAIASMASDSEKLQQLRPVTFHLKADPQGVLQYGLIAEEVAKVYPDLVIRTESGRVDGVRYDELASILLNEAQQQQRKIAAQSAHIAAQAEQIRDLRHEQKQLTIRVAQLRDVQQQVAEMRAALLKLQAHDEFVAQR